MALRIGLLEAPSVEPLTLAEAKSHLRVKGTADDVDVASYLAGARSRFERESGRQLITARYRGRLDAFPRRERPIRIPLPPLQSVDLLQYIDLNGDTQTLTEDEDYVIDTDCEPGEIRLAYGKFWPLTRRQPFAVYFEFTCGYGDDETAVDENIRNALRLMLGASNEYREDLLSGTIIAAIPRGADTIIASYKPVEIIDYDVDEREPCRT